VRLGVHLDDGAAVVAEHVALLDGEAILHRHDLPFQAEFSGDPQVDRGLRHEGDADVEVHAHRGHAVEIQGLVHLEEVVVRADLHRAVPGVADLQPDRAPPGVDLDRIVREEILARLPFEPYAPVRRRLLAVLRAVNRERKGAGFGPVPVDGLRLRRRACQPFERVRRVASLTASEFQLKRSPFSPSVRK
jgi:hypothetical protein